MKTTACTLLVMVAACLRVAADDTVGTSDTQIVGMRGQIFRDVGPRRSALIGVDVCCDKLGTYDVIHGLRPIYLDAQGRDLLGSFHGTDSGRPPVRIKAKKGYAIGAMVVRNGFGVDGLSATFMKLENGRLDPAQSYESEWVGGNTTGGTTCLGGSGEVVVGLFGSQNVNSQLNGLGLILSKKPIIPASQKRSPLPDEAAQAKALKLAKEVYGQEGAAAKTPSQKSELAKKLLHAADESKNDPAGRYILLKLARDFAMQATDGLSAFEAIDQMAEQFQVNDVEMKMNVLSAFSKRAKSPADHKSIGDEAAGLIDGAIAHDKIDLAVKLCELALIEARASRDPDLIREVKTRSEQCKALGKAYREMKEAEAVLDKKPDDALANLTVGKYYCFQKGDWEKGLPMLALGQDEALKAVAIQEISGVTKADDQVKVGDAWWDLAGKEQGRMQATLRGRADYWYQRALPGVAGLAKAKLDKRIKEYEEASEAAEGKKTEGSAAAKRAAKYLPGLVAQYYNDAAFTQVAKSRIDAAIDFAWSYNQPDPNVNAQNFSARWIGYLKAPKAGRYVIRVRGHYDFKLMIDNAFVISNEVVSVASSDQRAQITLTAGYHLFAMQFVHGVGAANLNLSWQPPGETTWTVIPEQNLFHDQRQEQLAGLGKR
jgi:hypothetical protein